MRKIFVFVGLIYILLFSSTKIHSAYPACDGPLEYSCNRTDACCIAQTKCNPECTNGKTCDCGMNGCKCVSEDGGGNTGAPSCPTGKVSNGLCEAGLRPITVDNCCKVSGTGTGTPTPTPKPGVGGNPCTFAGCSTDHAGYSYLYSTTCSTACTLGCDGKFPSWPTNYACLATGPCNAGNKCTPDVCTPACKTGEICNAVQKCIPAAPNICTPVCGANEICNDEKKCIRDPKCQPFVSASVAPSTLRPFDQVTVKCNYGKRLDNISIIGAGLKNCRYSRYEGTDNIFACEASPNAGFYDDTMCVTAADKDCKEEKNKVGNINILGTEVHYDQDIVLPFGSYTLSARVFSVLSKGKGNRIILICNSDTCTTGVNKNGEISSIAFPEATDFAIKSLPVALKGTGDDRHYLLRVSVDKGSEAYFDYVSLKDAKQRELVQNSDFTAAVQTSVSTKQLATWGEGDNKVGYYYGSVADEQVTNGGIITPTGGPTPTPGKSTAMSLTMKIKLQGVTKKPKVTDALSVQIKLLGTASGEPPGAGKVGPIVPVIKTVAFTVDDAGIWTGKADFDMPTGGGYKIYIKAPKHIQKKICDAAPTEAKGGTYHCAEGNIVLVAGNNTFDFSNILQMAGDLPEGGRQNGIVDAYDTTFVRQNLGSVDPEKLKIGDLNFDGIIDTQDYSMVLQSLSIKFDEE